MRFLFLDDSGKAHPNNPGPVAVFGGLSLDEDRLHQFNRQIQGAKFKYFPKRGRPTEWEIKSLNHLSRNDWQRRQHRDFVLEVGDIIRRNEGTVYSVAVDKRNANKPVAEAWVVPLMIQRLTTKFHAEVQLKQTTGTIVCDWSTYQLDEHISKCFNSMVVTKGMVELRGGITYSSSAANEAVQVADLVAACFRRVLEGQTHLSTLAQTLKKLALQRPNQQDVDGYAVETVIQIF